MVISKDIFDLGIVKKNVLQNISEQYCGLQNIVKYIMPCIISATVFRGLSEQALLQPAEFVALTASRVLYGIYIGSMALGVFNGIRVANSDFLAKKTVEKVVIPQAELEKMKSQIESLVKNLHELNMKFDPEYAKNYKEKIQAEQIMKQRHLEQKIQSGQK